MDRRNFLANALKLGLGIYFFPFAKLSAHQKGKKVVVIGIDGMDVSLTRHYMEKGFLPNLRRIAEKGGMHPMATSVPPQSPTAWSNVAVGADTAVHGIYDFIHRDPKTMSPFLSTSKVKPSSRTMHLGPYRIPLAGGGVENLRKGKPFWDYLAEFDVPSTLFKMPVNFPCLSDKINMASGMGTPDMRGGYGNFTLFTTAPEKFKEEISGGRIIRVAFKGGRAETSLPGPANTLLSSEPEIPMPVRIYRDRANPVIKVNIGDNELLLQEGEWSDWIRISYPTIGKLFPIKAICKFYVQKVHAGFSMYVSPLNIDPSDPALPVVSPPAYGKQLVENVGLFYTQGFPEDTKALSEGIFSEDEYLELADQIIDERERLFRFELERFQKSDRGLFFFYVSSIDQNSHMYWRTVDAKHPLYNEEIHSRHGRTIRNFYSRIDGMLGRLLEQCDINDPNFTVMVMSDHGFSPFRRQVNLNTWLYKNGYMALSSSRISEGNHFFSQVNWRRTGAYNIGINSLYLNLKGREKNGVVLESQASKLRKDIKSDLLKLVDPLTGEKAVSRVFAVSERERAENPSAPDLIVGWNSGYRTSWDSILGDLSSEIITDNLDKWSGDHCVDPSIVPAVLISNKPASKDGPSDLRDIAPTILAQFGIPIPKSMTGQPLFSNV